MSAPEIVKELVAKFEKNIKAYKSSSYNEEQVKQEFINPFFESLGWDVSNKSGAAPQYRDVIFEDSIKVGKGTKAPDYCFTLAGRKMFFLEAKKPSVNIREDKSPAYQVRRYAWSAKLSLSILTDFEELAIYESKTRPLEKESASTGRIALYNFKDYIEKWDEIANVFSKEAVLTGSFDKFIDENTGKKGTSEVDSEFLKEIEEWRLILARNIAIRNSQITVEELNYAVQQTIDRIIFLRMAEDRGIEPYEQLLNLLDNGDIYKSFAKLCKKSDDKYNAGLFHFKEEENISLAPDELTLDLAIDDGVFKTIIKNLYYPKSPYEFSVISPEILGNVYEQFIGKVIRLTKGHQAKVEEKPEVKKAGGVFYTPQYIVDYIVKNTVGKLLEGKTPNQVANLRIIDPACGSGSFLLGAYSYLLNWHRDYYSTLDKPPKNTIYEGKNNEIHLTIQKKKEILLNNIYGVDIDTQAVEVTKLSLLLKVLEDENKDALEQQQKLFQERVLPFLGDNIRCGNSLIATDIMGDENISHEEIANINPFNWEEEFPAIFENGGFDVAIGNPPYVRQERIKELKPYLKDHYETYTGVADLYVYFFEKGLNILKEKGYLSYICSNKFTRANYGKKLRNFILNNSIINFNDYAGDKIFKGATVDPCVIVIKREKNEKNFILVSDDFEVDQDRFNDSSWSFVPPKVLDLKEKIINQGIKLKNIEDIVINNGIKTGYNQAFIINENTKNSLIDKNNKNEDLIKKILRGRDINKWYVNFNNIYIILTKIGTEIENYAIIKEHLDQFKDSLKKRRDQGNHYWELRPCSYYEDFERPKIIWAEITQEPYFYYDEEGYYMNNKCFMITSEKTNLKFLNSLLLSNLFKFLFKQMGNKLGDSGYELRKIIMNELPIVIPPIEILNIFQNLADKMIQLNKDLANAKTPHEKKLLEKHIEAIDEKIDKMVYELYGLTEEEIAIVEESLDD